MDIFSLFPVGNAAGWCKSLEEVERLAKSAAQFIVVGSITLLPRDGNSGNTFNGDEAFTLNALGLPNPGIERIESIGPDMIRAAHTKEKPIIISIAGFTPEEFSLLAKKARAIGFDGVEFNLGCPNVADGGKRKPIISYRPDLIRATLEASQKSLSQGNENWFVSIKVSPMDPERMDEVAAVLNESPFDTLVTQNTIPNCLDFNLNGTPIINTPDKTGYAGGSGKQVLQQALGQVHQWRKRLPKDIAVWGVGGVQHGDDVRKMLWAGADAVQIGTAYFISGARVFSNIASQFLPNN